jgi:putative protease
MAQLPINSAGRRRPELLAPAGDAQCLRAAIENGADAVYFGLNSGFNARARAANFEVADLPDIMALLHRRGVKGYVTLNTLIFPSELAEIEQHVREVAAAGVDAVLVQDLGLVQLIRAISPDLPIHASTQMTLTSSQSIAAAEELGVERVVLARELSIEEIHLIKRETTMPLEVFVHGALCVAYSGQCLTSESLGGRSANRGQCAQACRLPYDLLCDGKEIDTKEQKYLLSPQDLAAYALVPDLIDAGVCSLKIEGRLKTPEYVANITRHYREAIDSAMAGKPVKFTRRQVEEMELSFSRGFSPGWLKGCDHKMLVPAISSSKRGVLLGEVRDVKKGRVAVVLSGSVKRGDGVVFDCGRAEDDQQGGRVYEVFRGGRSLEEPASNGLVELAFAHGGLDFDEIWPGQQIWKTDDPELTNRLRKTYVRDEPVRRQPVDLTVLVEVGSQVRVEALVGDGPTRVVVESEEVAQAATRHPLDETTLRDQLGRLGKTPFELRNLQATLVGQPMLPFSSLGKLRHALVEALERAVIAVPARTMKDEPALELLRSGRVDRDRDDLPTNDDLESGNSLTSNQLDRLGSSAAISPQLHVLCRSLPQLREVLAAGVTSVYADFQDIREFREAVQASREAGAKIFLATPRIQKPKENGIFLAMLKAKADGILVRNLGGLRFYAKREVPIVADFSLNAANDLTTYYLRDNGAARVTPSYDLNREQLLELVSSVQSEFLEVVVHQHMPMFHMEHCVFCAMISPGTNKTNCGRPCDRHEVKLRDRIGMEHPLVADVGCRNTLFNAVPQSAAEAVPTLLARGVRHFRVELLDVRGKALQQVLDLYRQLLSGDVTGHDVWSRLKASNRVGVTRGTLEERRDPLAML